MKKSKKFKYLFCAALVALSVVSCKKESRIEMSFPEKYEGKKVELISFVDSVPLASSTVTGGKAEFISIENDSVRFPLFAQVVIDGRVRAYYVIESGTVNLSDSMSVPSGSPLNDRLSGLLSTLDSIEDLDDMDGYTRFVEKCYNENKDNALGSYFGVEWLKYAEPSKVDSFLNVAPEGFRETRRVKYYENFARHRAMTAPGMKYIDLQGETISGKPVNMSAYIEHGKYTLVDFWASWCPYCIKELPDLLSLYADCKDKGFEIVGVAVRDKTDNTSAIVKKHALPWPVVYNTQKVPYDIYGFSGIPHHILIGPDGVIISRGENISQIRERLEAVVPAAGEAAVK